MMISFLVFKGLDIYYEYTQKLKGQRLFLLNELQYSEPVRQVSSYSYDAPSVDLDKDYGTVW